MRCLQQCKDPMFVYSNSNDLEIVGYVNFDFAGSFSDMKSISSYKFKMTGGAVSWGSVKQTITISSTMQADFITCYEATIQLYDERI